MPAGRHCQPTLFRLLSIALLGVGLSEFSIADTVSFRRDVMTVLSKAGCNAGACHGNGSGKGGFKLSLRGQNPEFDYHWLTREADGRRIDRLHPDRSLALLKPLGKVPHQGGARFREGSLEHRILRDWITSGAAGPISEPTLTSLEAVPTSALLLEPEESVQVVVIARFSDGSRRGVTSLATYEVSNLLADVSRDGRVSRRNFGDATVIARYLDRQVPVRVTFVPARPGFVWSDPSENNFIDRFVFAKLQQLRVNPSELSDDHVFVRRAFLDALGVLPTATEAREFCEDTSPDKRERLIEALLQRPEFADHWALKWSDVLRNEEKVLDPKGVEVFHAWIRQSMADGKPLDRFVRELIRAEGSSYENPPTNYWRANRSPTVRGETTARLFLGARLQCAKCHNHPFDRWTQDDYYSWAAVFARVDYEIVENKRKDKLDKNEFNGEQIIQISDGGAVRDPRNGEVVWPKLLGDRQLGPGSYHDRLTPLAVWLTSAENRLFAKSLANFIWYHLLGHGIVEPIDDFRATNPPSHPELLDALADCLVESGFDLRHVVATIMRSRVYQLSAIPNETNEDDDRNFSRAIVHRLPAEKLLDAQTQVLDAPVSFNGYPRGLRAGQLPGIEKVRIRDEPPAPGDRFLRTFGKPERLLACECERSNETTLSQAFMLIGGDVNELLERADNRIARLAASPNTNAEIVNELCWTALSRAPTTEELDGTLRYLDETSPMFETKEQQALARLAAQFNLLPPPDDRRSRLQDVAWALLNSKEFIFRH
ncbi:MAG: hypothetical protein CMJ64_01290 [Planctomycetaceae bacterium]|nr:hypothetical protein [Planctomycetaceae bacterium]